MSPFNFTVARFLLGPLSYYYFVGGGGDVGDTSQSTLENDVNELQKIYGIELLSQAEFDFLVGNNFDDSDANTVTVDMAMELVKSITAKINNTFVTSNDGTTYSTWPVLSIHVKDQLQENVNYDFIYPAFSDTNIDILHSNMVVRSALEDGYIKLPGKQPTLKPHTPATDFGKCFQLYTVQHICRSKQLPDNSKH